MIRCILAATWACAQISWATTTLNVSTDGPLPTLEAARDAIRKLPRPLGEPVDVIVAPGVYSLQEPFVLLPEDSGTEACPITYRGMPGREPVISGGRRIAGFRDEGGVWVAEIPEVKAGTWYFGALWVNGERRQRSRLPLEGYYYTAGTADPATTAFKFSPGDLKAWPNLTDDIFVVVYHSWETSIHRIASLDEANSIVTFTGPAAWPFQQWGPRQRFHVENAPEGLAQPGTWRLERATGRLSYRPKSGEDMARAEVIAPVARQLLLLQGKPEARSFVEHVRFENLRFHHTEWPIGPRGHSDAQAAFSVEAAVQAVGARQCRVEACEIAHTSNYGIWLRTGCRDVRVARNHVHDLGAGGVRIGEGSLPAEEIAAQRNVVDNNFIRDGGKIFRGAVGVWIGMSSHNTLSHNEICDFDYTGVSVGWSWGYAPSSAHHNVLEYNHIHSLGRGVLNDMGAIYTLGISPGTVERFNLMHDIRCYVFGGWGVYTDEGSTDILIENNVVYNTTSGCFHQHYGKENVLRNNIFAFGEEGVLRRSREEEHISFIFERNIVLARGSPLHIVGWGNGKYRIDNNIYWDLDDPEPEFFGMSFEAWKAKGRDQHSLVADPLFRNPGAYDFRLADGSPAAKVGFKPFSIDDVGLYGDPAWTALPRAVQRAPYVPPRREQASDPVADGFEQTAPGDAPARATAYEEGAGTIRVTEETAASGKRALKFTDAPGLKYRFNPHLVYALDFKRGTVEARFSLRLEKGAVFYHEWRDAAQPYHVGPTMRIEADGTLDVRGKALVRLPAATWLGFVVTCALPKAGQTGGSTFDLAIEIPGEGAPRRFPNLACDPEFRRLQWLGFVADADAQAVFYLDDLSVRPAPR